LIRCSGEDGCFGAAAFAVIITGINDGARGHVICEMRPGRPRPDDDGSPQYPSPKAVDGLAVIEAQPCPRVLRPWPCTAHPCKALHVRAIQHVRGHFVGARSKFVYFCKTDQMSPSFFLLFAYLFSPRRPPPPPPPRAPQHSSLTVSKCAMHSCALGSVVTGAVGGRGKMRQHHGLVWNLNRPFQFYVAPVQNELQRGALLR
jgi:hypothetical protein